MEELQKGLNYDTRDATKLEFFVALESSLKTSGLNEVTQQKIQQTIVPLTRQMQHHAQMNTQEQKILKRLKNRKDIVIPPADKGRTTVVMDKEDYIRKAEELLKDENIYQLFETNPIQKFDNQINKTLNKLFKAKEITKQDKWRMKSNGPVLPRSTADQKYTN
ncbi:unnamed protein product [Heterobilharzia americana]|nr:unnamed protein product [Heterobilharzia americana]